MTPPNKKPRKRSYAAIVKALRNAEYRLFAAQNNHRVWSDEFQKAVQERAKKGLPT